MTTPNPQLAKVMARAALTAGASAAPAVPVDEVLAVAAAPAPEAAPVAIPAAAVAVAANDVVTDLGALQLFEAIKAATGDAAMSVFKVAALQSGYTAEMGALSFEDITRLQTASVDAYAARMKLLRTVYGRIKQFSCEHIKFQDWLKQTAQGDYDTLMYGLYAATYPGDNEFDVRCRHCGHENKLTANVGALARVAGDDVYGEIRKLLDPATDFRGAIQGSLVGHIVQRKLPKSGVIAEVRNPSMQDYLDNVQWFVQNQDRQTGNLPDQLAGSETVQTLTMYVPRLLVPIPGGSQYAAVSDKDQRASLIRRLSQADGRALVDAVDEQSKKLDVSYQLPDFNCRGCGKKNDELFLDFETLLFIKLREKA